ncbi:MAG: hypothetical protein ACSHXF_04165 [Aquaticitalea sp.]
MNFGDYFSNEEKKSLLLPKGLIIGTVIRAFATFTIPPKEKRFIIVGFKHNKIHIACVLINSDLNLNVNNTPELIDHQLKLSSEGREYLDHDSFIDCSEIQSLDISDINKKIDENANIILGQVAKKDMDIIIKTMIDSDLIKGQHKKRCGFFDYKFDE